MSRAGNFSSSNAWKLMTYTKDKKGFGAPALKYIKQVNHERRLGREIKSEIDSKPTSWGKLCEEVVFKNKLDTSYTRFTSADRLFHPTLPLSGIPDFVKPGIVCDCKAPHSMEVFCDKIDSLADLGTYKEEFPEDYWQHVSNSVLMNDNGFPVSKFEAIIFCPYQDELEEIREMASSAGEAGEYAKWVFFATDDQLPYIIRGGVFKNLNIYEFPIFDRDAEAFKQRVGEASKLLIPFPKLVEP
jgi:hypothetical protein